MRFFLVLSFLGLVAVMYASPVCALIGFAARSDLDSYVLLVPAISSWLLFLKRGQLRMRPKACLSGGAIAFAIGVALFIAAGHWRFSLGNRDYLALTTASFLFVLFAGVLLFIGRKWLAAASFPMCFLFFMIPLPGSVVSSLEEASQWASAVVAEWLMNVGGVPNLREGVVFRLPGLAIRVAQECSGIHSSLVLFITGLLASWLLLRSYWRRAVLLALVIPLGVLRNSFRIFVIGWLCVNVGPEMIDSPVHHRGGPLFFVLSLFPFLILLWVLRRGKSERVDEVTADPHRNGRAQGVASSFLHQKERSG
jgi:exosortase C (VPDSG-CTERM-specific)